MAIQQGRTHRWKKSSYSGGNGACLEVKAPGAETFLVRDSKVPAGARLGFRPVSWEVFVKAAGRGALTGESRN
ncbi:DUF397 domain-containing protein [Streptomyces sp. YIM 98790]|uniref:DUF397 domain-containing protein n=1 Tax=Streptomyces sp. YIM 98790 TaxID=2689077 RepID=UPI00140BCBA9|nr:DUF397 domain-containing protein [Streptomyces sp. YIM 98790]